MVFLIVSLNLLIVIWLMLYLKYLFFIKLILLGFGFVVMFFSMFEYDVGWVFYSGVVFIVCWDWNMIVCICIIGKNVLYLKCFISFEIYLFNCFF